MNLMGYHVYYWLHREVWKPVKDESITFRLEPDNEYDKWAVAGVSGSLSVGHVLNPVMGVEAEQMQNWADLTTNSGHVSKSLHNIPAPPQILPTKFRHFVNFPEWSWSKLYMVQSKMVWSLVFHFKSKFWPRRIFIFMPRIYPESFRMIAQKMQ